MLEQLAKPPIIEVGAAVEWPRLAEVDAVFLAGWFAHRRQRYPRYRILRAAGPDSVSVDFGNAAPALRGWFESECGSWVVQLDNQRLALHWRRTGPDSDYPRFGSVAGGVRDRMVEEWQAFQAFLGQRDISIPQQLVVAVFKVDALLQGRHWKDEEDASRLLPVLRHQPLWGTDERAEELLLGVSTADDSGMSQRWQLRMLAAGQQSLLRLETGARCPLPEAGAVDSALTRCNERVNRLFDTLISAEARHERFRGEG